ncbi:hypothetical protein BV394_12475 [Brevirhabdus pacifica]|uniref:DUF7282 domain-containing protein n=1 Tax=Brevirhabdus pacifica TaxID=1267768 RepID=A0A1U7DKM3_9RHOB|nr:hypothetical protein [Brevirhabdus pacifica]APX90443.1 hypothetical protein BV394_12475 [Brevirhabdus pacifica]PJJ85459.1 hypothetical protein CLV77_2329 [Brevirhabdus pacifica]
MKLIAIAAALSTTLAAPAMAEHLILKTEGTTVKHVVTFPSVMIDKDGYLTIHALKDGQPVIPGSIGHVAVKAGTTENVEVEIMDDAVAGTDYIGMLHYETNDNDTYDFGEGSTDVDTPATKADGSPYALPFTAGK